MLDGYDFTMLTLILLDIQREFSVSSAAAGALGTVTLLTRLGGGIAGGFLADRCGRKPVMMISILWFSIFAFLSGFAPSYAWLFCLRALFGVGMGAEWAAGMPLALEHWPEHRRGLIAGVLQGAFSWGFIMAAVVFHIAYPLVPSTATLGWRAMLWSGLIPALLVLWIRRRVPESPLWLQEQEHASIGKAAARSWTSELRTRVFTTALVMGALMFSYQSMSFWYATLLREDGRNPLPYLVALNVGGIAGAAFWGIVSDTRVGHRGTMTLASGLAIAGLPLFLYSSEWIGLMLGTVFIGITGAGIIGLAPAYIGGQFSTAVRGAASGMVYHSASVIGALAPLGLGYLQDASWSLRAGMACSIAVASTIASVLVWTAPESAGSSTTAP